MDPVGGQDLSDWLLPLLSSGAALAAFWALALLAMRRRGWPVWLVAFVSVLLGTLASTIILWSNEVFLLGDTRLALTLEGALTVMAFNLVLHLLIWALIAWLVVRRARVWAVDAATNPEQERR